MGRPSGFRQLVPHTTPLNDAPLQFDFPHFLCHEFSVSSLWTAIVEAGPDFIDAATGRPTGSSVRERLPYHFPHFKTIHQTFSENVMKSVF